ncbi:3-deoxy-7-phosphoheptulonate synthase class II [Kitasatospora sp. NA04385]|uniref:class II 3-deoxy-7-phosphoheptulonate synthase n=1 Tax=Kitasatospora sp. NA04385 TaxID=2742135 RepID=UPI00158FF671|nr:3-deoxy-7-phosphoheptulonate synthase class II [Kitasatospora sp. NA04385]QKW21674.1 3-deoxy-7-phosphoheptulonate synthase class II [Kitasatospora sp. NA04385]
MTTVPLEAPVRTLHRSWRDLPADQQPDWPDPVALRRVLADLSAARPLVSAGQCDRLRDRLAAVARGEAFLLQGGDCAETFDGVSAGQVSDKVRTLQQMALLLTQASSLPVVKVGRMAGQYAKPRSSGHETRDGRTLPSYRGDAVNGAGFTADERRPDPERLRTAHRTAARTLELIRAASDGGSADLERVHAWNRDFVADSPARERYRGPVRDFEATLRLLRAFGARGGGIGGPAEVFTSHEALLLDYEDALTRLDPYTGARYALSAHLLWIGERTRRIDGAHVAFAASLRNPVAVKIGPTAEPDEVLELVRRIDPHGEPGRLTLISRMGAGAVRDRLPRLVERIAAAGAPVAWVCDPMHGNTVQAPTGHKTRRLDDVMDEVTGFFEVHRALGTHPGGLHLELTGEEVTECVGGSHEVTFADLPRRYETGCDPRLNRSQSVDLAFRTAELLRGQGGRTGRQAAAAFPR